MDKHVLPTYINSFVQLIQTLWRPLFFRVFLCHHKKKMKSKKSIMEKEIRQQQQGIFRIRELLLPSSFPFFSSENLFCVPKYQEMWGRWNILKTHVFKSSVHFLIMIIEWAFERKWLISSLILANVYESCHQASNKQYICNPLSHLLFCGFKITLCRIEKMHDAISPATSGHSDFLECHADPVLRSSLLSPQVPGKPLPWHSGLLCCTSIRDTLRDPLVTLC